MPLSELFFNSLMVTGSGLFLAILAILYKSKCRSIRCCGCEIIRDVDIEERIDEIEIENQNHQETKQHK